MTRIIMHGCNGKMGHTISNLVAAHNDCSIVAGIDPNTVSSFDYPVFKSLEDCTLDADVVIDFSIAGAVEGLLKAATDKKLPVVVCTTGLSQEQIDMVHQTAENIPVLFSANMSLGINLLISLVQKATSILSPAGFDIEIIEKHHNQKVDAPSGTALYIADSINETLNNEYAYQYDRSKDRVKRPKKEIGLHAVRGGTIVGEHQVIFAGQDEVIEINHMANSKDVFAVGSINAALFLAGKAPGLYNMGHIID